MTLVHRVRRPLATPLSIATLVGLLAGYSGGPVRPSVDSADDDPDRAQHEQRSGEARQHGAPPGCWRELPAFSLALR